MEALWCGFKRHSVDARLCSNLNPAPCDLAVFWSHKRDPIIAHQKAAGRDYLVIERGYLGNRMGRWCSLGFNGLNGRADFCLEHADDERGKRWRKLLKPLHFGEYTLVMGQVPGDKSVEGLNVGQWVDDMAEQAAKIVAKPVRHRPHPLGGVGTKTPRMRGELSDALARAHWVITYNSNSGVDAALAGVPVVAMDRGSMAWDVAAHELRYHVVSDQARIRWVNRLAWCQWTMDEIANGDAWEHLKKRYH